MHIHFHEEAAQTFQDVCVGRLGGLCVEVTPLEGGEDFDAVIVGTGSDWYDALRVRRFDEVTGEGTGEAFELRVASIKVW